MARTAGNSVAAALASNPASIRADVRNRESAAGAVLPQTKAGPSLSLAMTKRPPGMSMADRRLSTSAIWLLILVSQPVVQRQFRVDLPIVLPVDMKPRAATMLVGAADADLGTVRVSEKEIGKRIARPLAVEREISPRVQWIDRVEFEVKQVASEFHAVAARYRT